MTSLTPHQTDLRQRCLAGGLTMAQAAQVCGCSYNAIRGWAGRRGVKFTRESDLRRSIIWKALKGMDLAERVDYLVDLLEYYLPQGPEDLQFDKIGLQLTPMQALVLGYLAKRSGRIVTRTALHGAIYCHRPDCDWPDINLITVYVSYIRRAVRRAGLPIEIRTAWGQGGRLTRPEAFRFPWEAEYRPPRHVTPEIRRRSA